MKIYVAGKITGLENYRELFDEVVDDLRAKGNSVMNPSLLEGDEFMYVDFMRVCYAMIDVCEVVYFLRNWKDSKGAKLEYDYAVRCGKEIQFQV